MLAACCKFIDASDHGLSRQLEFNGYLEATSRTCSYSSVYRFLLQLDALQVPAVPFRLEFKAAEAVQVDFGAGPLMTDVHTGEVFKTWFFVMTSCWSRQQYVAFVRDRTVATWLGCHRRAFEAFCGVPSRVTIDDAKCAITKALYYEPEVQRAYGECAEGYGFKIDACPPCDPQKKGIDFTAPILEPMRH